MAAVLDTITHHTNELALPLFAAGTLLIVLGRTAISAYLAKIVHPHGHGETSALLGHGAPNIAVPRAVGVVALVINVFSQSLCLAPNQAKLTRGATKPS